MSEHRAKLKWERSKPDFSYENYDRTHEVTFPGGTRIQASSAVEYLGRREMVNPEELMTAALSSCHMLTFLAIASRKRLVVNSYEDEAVSFLEKGEDGKPWVKRAIIRPRAEFAEPAPSPEKILEMHQKAHENCFIALSVKTDIVIEPRL